MTPNPSSGSTRALVLGIAFVLGLSNAPAASGTVTRSGPGAGPVPPAAAPVRAIATSYSGVRVVDRYRYLENPDDPATQRFVRDRDAYADAILGRLDPTRSALRRRIGVLEHGTTRISGLVRAAAHVFYVRHGPFDHNDVLCERDAGGANERVVIDPGQDSARGSTSLLESFLPSPDGRFVAYALSDGDPSAARLHVIDTATLKDLPESADHAESGGATAWFDDGRSFVYDRYQPLLERHDPRAELRNQMALRHILGRSPEQDTPLFGPGLDPKIPFAPDDVPIVRTSAGSPYAVGLIRHGAARDLSVYVANAASLATSQAVWTPVADVADGVAAIDFTASTLFLLDHKNGSGYEVRAVPLAAPVLATAETLVPASADVIDGISVARDALYVRSRRGAAGKLTRIPLGADGIYRGTPQAVPLPGPGAILSLVTDPRLDGALLGLGTWLLPTRILDAEPGEPLVDTGLGGPSNPAGAGLRVADEESARSADGIPVPISILHDAALSRDGLRPTLIEVYGAYGRTTLPEYDAARTAWLERGGVYAICHPRGGGWYGDGWHRAAILANRNKTVDDLLACADHLIRRGYTSPKHLVGLAAGAGGLALGGAIVRRPDLFAAAIELAAVSDPIRAQFTATGAADAPEFGTTDTPAGAASLLAISPYAHVSDLTTYPAAFLEAGSGSTGVPPWQAEKFAARLEVAQAARRPVLLRSSESATDLAADLEAFGLWQAGDPGFGFVPILVPGPVGTAAPKSERPFSR